MTNRVVTKGLSKSYQIRHANRRQPYRRLSEEIVRFARNPMGMLRRADAAEEFWALRDVDFEVNDGEVVGVIGRNGAGKSTLLKLLSRITQPSRGSIELNGRVASLLEVGTGFHPELTGRENIFLNGAVLGMSRTEIRKNFDAIVDFAEVERFLDTPVKRYSSGMYVRLAFAVAAHLEPEILIVDEVLAVGDAEFQKKCVGKMSGVAKSGRTVLFVSHQMGTVSQLCTRCLYLRSGELVANGPTQDVIQTYLSDGSDGGAIQGRARSEAGEDAKVWFTDISTRSAVDDQPASTFSHSTPVRLRVKFSSSEPILPRGLACSIGLQDTLNRRVFSDYRLVDQSSSSGLFEIVIDLPPEFVAPGNYSFIATLHTFQSEVFDRLPGICEISIVDGGSKFSMFSPGSYGCVMLPCDWQVSACA